MRAEVCFAYAAVFVQMRSSDRVQGSLQFFALGFYNFYSSGIQFVLIWTPFGRLLDAFWMPFGTRDVPGVHCCGSLILCGFWNVSATEQSSNLETFFVLLMTCWG